MAKRRSLFSGTCYFSNVSGHRLYINTPTPPHPPRPEKLLEGMGDVIVTRLGTTPTHPHVWKVD